MCHTICNDDVGIVAFECFFLSIQLNPLDVALLIQNIAGKENINVEIMLFTSKLKTSHSHRMRIIAFSRRTSFTVALAYRTRERHV